MPYMSGRQCVKLSRQIQLFMVQLMSVSFSKISATFIHVFFHVSWQNQANFTWAISTPAILIQTVKILSNLFQATGNCMINIYIQISNKQLWMVSFDNCLIMIVQNLFMRFRLNFQDQWEKFSNTEKLKDLTILKPSIQSLQFLKFEVKWVL